MISIDHITEEPDRESLFSSLLVGLEHGDFDSLIAQELIEEVEADQSTPRNQARLLSIQNMIGFSAAAGVDPEFAMEIYSSRQGISWWQTRMSTSLRAAKIIYRQQLESRQDIRKASLLQSGMILPENPRKKLPAVAAEYVKRQSLLRNTNFKPNNARFTRAEFLATQARMRSSKRGYRGGTKTNGKSAEASLPLLEVPRELRFFDANGDTLPMQDGDIPSVVDEYVRKSGGNDRILAGRIIDFLETIQLVDFSGPIVGGYVSHERNFSYKGHNVGTLWQVRPDKVAGPNSLGAHSKKMRILCTLDEKNACILKIIDKDEMHKYKSSLGIKSGYK
jgi:hypothetical protein